MHSNDSQMLVLTVLAERDLHGYAINTAIHDLTGRRLGPGSLYGALTRLEARELICEVATDDDSGRTRTMQITAAGRTTLRSELQQMARVSAAGLRSLGLSTS